MSDSNAGASMSTDCGIILENLSIGRNGISVAGPLAGRFSGPGLHLILGKAGAGKTTLLMTLGGFLSPVSGRIAKQGGGEWPQEGKVCLAFQNPENLFFLPTVGEEVSYALLARGESLLGAEEIGKAWLTRWGLPAKDFWQRNPLTLSGGEKRRVALAACTVFRPPLILLDEPLAGLDREGRESLLAVMNGLSGECLALVVTHDPEPFFPICKSVLLLDKGLGQFFAAPRAFLKAAILNGDLYPLPTWYKNALSGRLESKQLPWPVAELVFDFLNLFKKKGH